MKILEEISDVLGTYVEDTKSLPQIVKDLDTQGKITDKVRDQLLIVIITYLSLNEKV